MDEIIAESPTLHKIMSGEYTHSPEVAKMNPITPNTILASVCAYHHTSTVAAVKQLRDSSAGLRRDFHKEFPSIVAPTGPYGETLTLSEAKKLVDFYRAKTTYESFLQPRTRSF